MKSITLLCINVIANGGDMMVLHLALFPESLTRKFRIFKCSMTGVRLCPHSRECLTDAQKLTVMTAVHLEAGALQSCQTGHRTAYTAGVIEALHTMVR